MDKKEILKPVARIHGGVRLPHYKGTAEQQTVACPIPNEVTIAMSQHIGAPCTPLVKKGDQVFVGTKIGDSDAFVSAPIHASVSGTVKEIKDIELPSGMTVSAVVIESDGQMTPDPNLKPVPVKTVDDLVNAARESGLVGLGGAGFPAHVKLKPSEEKPIDTLIVNGAECEPYITADYRECLENSEDLLEGVYRIKNLLNIPNVIIAIEENKPAAIQKLYEIAHDKQDTNNEVRLMKLRSRYPQGAEKVLIYSATGRKLPIGKLPADVGCLVMNVTSIAFLNRYIKTGMPLVEKRITVAGNAVTNAGNVLTPIGTSVAHILDFCKAENAEKVLFGGPMMGNAIANTDTPLNKQNNAVLAFSGIDAVLEQPSACINCGRCRSACPMKLTPAKVDRAGQNATAETFNKLNVMYCIECGSCAFVCPARRPLVQSMRLAKNTIRKAAKK